MQRYFASHKDVDKQIKIMKKTKQSDFPKQEFQASTQSIQATLDKDLDLLVIGTNSISELVYESAEDPEKVLKEFNEGYEKSQKVPTELLVEIQKACFDLENKTYPIQDIDIYDNQEFERIEEELIRNALIEAKGNHTKAAKSINISERKFYQKVIQFDIKK